MIKKEVFDEQVNEYRSLISETPLYKGLEKVLDSEELLELVEQRIQDYKEECEEEGEFERYVMGTIIDSVDIFVMKLFAEQLIENLIEEGFIWDKENEGWTVPEKYRKAKFAEITGEQTELTNYGIVWDMLPMDYDTSIREIVSEKIDEVMYDNGMMEY
jgi:hypothetical protein